jgi:hypothetical protein
MHARPSLSVSLYKYAHAKCMSEAVKCTNLYLATAEQLALFADHLYLWPYWELMV